MPIRPRGTLLLLAGLLVAACDSGVQDPEPVSMVGTWTVSRTVSREMATVSESQTAVDPSLPPSGAVVLSGSQTGTLRHVEVFTTAVNDYRRIKLTDREPGATPRNHHELVFIQRTHGGIVFQSLELTRFGEAGSESYTSEATSEPYLFSARGPSVSVDTAVRVAAAADGVVHVEGTFTMGNRRLRAGEESVLSETVTTPSGLRYTFRDDGTLTIVETGGVSRPTVRGTWAREADSVHIWTLGAGGRVVATTHVVQRAGAGVVLSSRTPRDACDAACREDRIILAAGLPGTLRETWRESELYLTAQ